MEPGTYQAYALFDEGAGFAELLKRTIFRETKTALSPYNYCEHEQQGF